MLPVVINPLLDIEIALVQRYSKEANPEKIREAILAIENATHLPKDSDLYRLFYLAHFHTNAETKSPVKINEYRIFIEDQASNDTAKRWLKFKYYGTSFAIVSLYNCMAFINTTKLAVGWQDLLSISANYAGGITLAYLGMRFSGKNTDISSDAANLAQNEIMEARLKYNSLAKELIRLRFVDQEHARILAKAISDNMPLIRQQGERHLDAKKLKRIFKEFKVAVAFISTNEMPVKDRHQKYIKAKLVEIEREEAITV